MSIRLSLGASRIFEQIQMGSTLAARWMRIELLQLQQLEHVLAAARPTIAGCCENQPQSAQIFVNRNFRNQRSQHV